MVEQPVFSKRIVLDCARTDNVLNREISYKIAIDKHLTNVKKDLPHHKEEES